MDYFTYLRSGDYGYSDVNNMNFGGQNFGYSLASNQMPNMPWPLDFQSKSTQYNLNKLITGIKSSINNEQDDELEYMRLAELAPNNEQKEIINSIKDNEIIHSKILRKIFTELTGVVIPENPTQKNATMSKDNSNYTELLTKAMLGELRAVERYREFLAYAPNMEIYNMIMYILTDEIRHAIKYQYLLMLNK
ncbi:MAG: ferritin-like domain-containing protein [Clostridia bacterium]|nr:ferritin-like domain-containing protein [Clostridia bacterium]